MDSTFVSVSEGVGLALAAGLAAGAVTGTTQGSAQARRAGAAVAAGGGAALFALALDGSGHAIWPGLIGGPIVALLAYALGASLVMGAARRQGASAGPLAGMVIVAALAIAGIALLVHVASIVFLIAIAALVVARRERERRKYEGLRSLR